MPDTIDPAYFAPCGVNCKACTAHCNAKRPCGGCLSGDITRKSCRTCPRRNCALERGHIRCFPCADFPCKLIKSLDKSYRSRYGIELIQRGLDARQHGVEFVLEQDRVRYLCDCGGVLCEHDMICSECGRNAEA